MLCGCQLFSRHKEAFPLRRIVHKTRLSSWRARAKRLRPVGPVYYDESCVCTLGKVSSMRRPWTTLTAPAAAAYLLTRVLLVVFVFYTINAYKYIINWMMMVIFIKSKIIKIDSFKYKKKNNANYDYKRNKGWKFFFCGSNSRGKQIIRPLIYTRKRVSHVCVWWDIEEEEGPTLSLLMHCAVAACPVRRCMCAAASQSCLATRIH